MKALQKGFTIIEVMITASIFIVIATISTVILFDTINAEKKSDVQNSLYEDARILMDQLSSEIQRNAIDYEEYFSMKVSQTLRTEIGGADNKVYGMYYGAYSSKFFNPGESQWDIPSENPKNLGIECSQCVEGAACCNTGVKTCDPLNPQECYVIFTPSQDYSVGKNPFDGDATGVEKNNAFVNDGTGTNNEIIEDELYLINTEGTKKTIFAKQNIDDANYGIGMLELEGLDTDQNGTNDLFTCKQEYSCDLSADIYDKFFDGLNFPEINGQTNIEDLGLKFATQKSTKDKYVFNTSPFIPITPFRTSVVSLKFIINPPEDPYKGFAEAGIQHQPTVTILIEMEPSTAERNRYPGGWNNGLNVILQRTVSPGVTGDVQSYPPTNNVDWIKGL